MTEQTPCPRCAEMTTVVEAYQEAFRLLQGAALDMVDRHLWLVETAGKYVPRRPLERVSIRLADLGQEDAR